MIFKTFQKYINKSNLTFPFNKPLPSARNTLIVCSAVIIDPNNEWYEHIEEDTIEEWIWEILSDDKRKFFKSVVVRTSLLKYNYDFLLRSDIYHDYNKQNNHDIRFNPSQHKVTDGGIYYDEYHNIYSNRETAYLDYHLRSFRKPEYQNVAPFWIFIKTHLILLKGFLVLRLKDKIYLNGNSLSYGNKIKLYCQKVKKSFPIAEKAWKYYCYDNNPSTGKITNNKKTPSENSENINSVNLSNENNANSQDNPSQKNTSLIKSQNPEDVFAPYAHLWTYCKNCETSIYKQYAQKNKYICKHCAFHLPMESSDRIESLIDLGTWDPTDETLVSIDPYDEILRQRKKADSKVPPFFRGLLFLDDEDRLQRKDFDLSVIMDEFLERSGMKECTPDEILDRMFQLRDYLRRIAGVKDQDIKTFEELKLKKKLTKLSAIDRKKKTLEDLVNSLPSDKEELDIEGLDTEGPDTEKSTVEQTSTDTDQSTDTNQFTDTDQSTAEQSIAKKYTIKELVELFLLEERETKAELEKKEKNLASADNKDANQNSEKSTESEKDIETEKSTESEKDIETEKSTESEKDIESEEDIPYMNKVDFYQRETGLTDAVQTGIGQLDGIPVALAVMDFQFIGGSMGSVVGEKITRLIEYATYKSLPLIISCASGGARMQEGSFSLMQMAKISLALLDYQLNQKLLLVSLLTSPTTGGVTASFGMLGDLIIGEPDAYIAFAGKRVIEEVMKIELPEGVQEAEYLFEKGSLDLIVPRNLLKGVLSELLKLHGFFPLNENKILNLTSRYKILYGDLPLYGQLPRSK